jgi:Peptidase inhibitor family I36
MTKLKALLLALTLAAGIVLTAASPAAASWSDCTTPPEKFCTWLYHDGAGVPYYYTLTGNTNRCINIGAPYDNAISAVWNRFQYFDVDMYAAHDCTGSVGLIVQPIMGKTNLYADDNIYSSFYIH